LGRCQFYLNLVASAEAASDVVSSLQILLLNNVDELHEHIDHTQLTPDLGGSLQYDHQQWIQHRAVSIDHFSFVIRISIYFSVGSCNFVPVLKPEARFTEKS